MPEGIGPNEAAVMQEVIAEEIQKRNTIVICLTGAHAYGFPSTDSDIDLKAIHLAPTRKLLGLHPSTPTADRVDKIRGVEIDFTSNEIGLVLAGILNGNGNYLERVLGQYLPYESELLLELQPIVRRSLSRKVHAHYRGFAYGQRKELLRAPTVKKLLYVLRTTLTGIKLLETGELETNLPCLQALDLADMGRLIDKKQRGTEHESLPASFVLDWVACMDRLFARLDAARDSSPLPPAPPNEEEVNEWLVRARTLSLY
jgi:predicted nucleotidyltransferase